MNTVVELNPHKIAEDFVITFCPKATAAARHDGFRFGATLNPAHGPEQIILDDALPASWAPFRSFVIVIRAGDEELRDGLAIRIGDDRCRWTYWDDGDPTNIGTAINTARLMWADEIATIDDIPEEGVQQTFKTGFKVLDDHGLRITLPCLMPIIGPYGSGKSVWLRQLLVNLWMQHGWKSVLTSFEERVKPNYLRDYRRHLIGKRAELWTDEDIVHADAQIREGFVFLRRKRNTVLDMDRILDRIAFAVRAHGVKVVAIDPVNEIEMTPGYGQNKTDMMGQFLMRLKALADDYGLLVIVCAHPPKAGVEKRLQAGNMLTLNDGADTAHYGNKADIGICIWRRHTGATFLHLDKTKVHEVNGRPMLFEMIMSPQDSEMGQRFAVTRQGYELIGEDL